MGEANILIRTGGDRASGWASVIRSAALAEHLRQSWPTARVTVFADGDHEVHDWLWTRVRDLVALRPGLDLTEEMVARDSRGAADLVIFDLPDVPDDARCRAWLRDSRHVFVRSGLDRRTASGDVICGWHWSADDAEAPVEVVGATRALIAPSLRGIGAERSRIETPARELLVRLEGATKEQELVVAKALAGVASSFSALRFLTLSGFGLGHRQALAEACPDMEVLSGRGRLMECAARSDLAITMGAGIRYSLAASGLPQLVFAESDELTRDTRAFATCGAARDLGSIDSIDVPAFSASVASLAADPVGLASLSIAATSHVDGLGFERLLRATLPACPASLLAHESGLHGIEAAEIEGEAGVAFEQRADDLVMTELDELGTL